MKQTELDKLLNAARKESAARHGWTTSRGYLFTSTDYLFINIGIVGSPQGSDLIYFAQCKPLEFDNLFWEIAGLQENSKKPFSFRASGAWTAPATTFAQGYSPIVDFTVPGLCKGVDGVLSDCASRLADISTRIHDADSYLEFAEEAHARLLQQQPDTSQSVFRERLFAAILRNDMPMARRIVDDRRAASDEGGFLSGPGRRTFYDMANDYLNLTDRESRVHG